jgi:hypothetical protein
MNPIVRNILAVVAGAVLGSLVNGAIITLGHSIIPPPEGADLTTMEGFKVAIALFEPKHFVMPFLAHAVGTLVGAFLAAKIAGSYKIRMALIVGLLFFIVGLINVLSVPAPLWFDILDLGAAYLPMAFLGGMLAVGRKSAE